MTGDFCPDVFSPLPDLIGLTGYVGSGKSALARHLSLQYGYRVVHLADGVREALARLNPTVGDTSWCRLMNNAGYDWAKADPLYGPEVRRLQQAMGTDIGRAMFGEDCWVEAAFRRIAPGERIVVADIRFWNELSWIERRGGLVARVVRPGVGPANDHVSETALDGILIPAVVVNDSAEEDLPDKLIGAYYGMEARP